MRGGETRVPLRSPGTTLTVLPKLVRALLVLAHDAPSVPRTIARRHADVGRGAGAPPARRGTSRPWAARRAAARVRVGATWPASRAQARRPRTAEGHTDAAGIAPVAFERSSVEEQVGRLHHGARRDAHLVDLVQPARPPRRACAPRGRRGRRRPLVGRTSTWSPMRTDGSALRPSRPRPGRVPRLVGEVAVAHRARVLAAGSPTTAGSSSPSMDGARAQRAHRRRRRARVRRHGCCSRSSTARSQLMGADGAQKTQHT